MADLKQLEWLIRAAHGCAASCFNAYQESNQEYTYCRNAEEKFLQEWHALPHSVRDQIVNPLEISHAS